MLESAGGREVKRLGHVPSIKIEHALVETLNSRCAGISSPQGDIAFRMFPGMRPLLVNEATGLVRQDRIGDLAKVVLDRTGKKCLAGWQDEGKGTRGHAGHVCFWCPALGMRRWKVDLYAARDYFGRKVAHERAPRPFLAEK